MMAYKTGDPKMEIQSEGQARKMINNHPVAEPLPAAAGELIHDARVELLLYGSAPCLRNRCSYIIFIVSLEGRVVK